MSQVRADAAPPVEDDGLPLPRRRVAYTALAFGVAMAVLDGSIANTALPTIARDMNASISASIWIVNGFGLAVTASLFAFASLGQLRGPSRVYRIGVVTFVVGSLACACARTLPLLVAARVLQGLGAAGIMAISPAILREIFPRAQLGRAVGLNALVVAVSSAAGPTVGGVLLAIAPWPLLFAINIPFGLANIALNRALPSDRVRTNGALDITSVITSALGFTLVIWGIDGFARHESLWSILARLAVGVVVSIIFVRRQFSLAYPMIALELFRIAPFAMAVATSFATFTAQGLAYVALPFYLQTALGHTPLASGLLLTAWPLATACIAPIAGRLSDRVPVGIIATAGLAVLTVGLAFYARLDAATPSAIVLLYGAICGMGFGLFQAPNNREMMGSAPREKSPSAAGILAAVRVSGQTIGAALVAIVFAAFGEGALAASHPAMSGVVARAVPATLWLAAGCAALATVASSLRLTARRS